MKQYQSILQFALGALLISLGLFGLIALEHNNPLLYIAKVTVIILGVALIVRSYVYHTITLIMETDNPIRRKIEQLSSTLDASIRTTIFFSSDSSAGGVLDSRTASVETDSDKDELIEQLLTSLTQGGITVRPSSKSLFDSLRGYTIGIVDAEKGSRIRSHSHNIDQTTFFVSGKAKVVLNGETKYYESNELLRIPAMTVHSLSFLKDSVFVVLYDSVP